MAADFNKSAGEDDSRGESPCTTESSSPLSSGCHDTNSDSTCCASIPNDHAATDEFGKGPCSSTSDCHQEDETSSLLPHMTSTCDDDTSGYGSRNSSTNAHENYWQSNASMMRDWLFSIFNRQQCWKLTPDALSTTHSTSRQRRNPSFAIFYSSFVAVAAIVIVTIINPRSYHDRFVMTQQGPLRSSLPSFSPLSLHRLIFPQTPSMITTDAVGISRLHSSNPNSKLVIAGKMTVLDTFCNIAEMDISEGGWSVKHRLQLSLYNSYSGGEVYYLLVNHTFEGWEGPASGSGTGLEERVKEIRGGELIVVGAFDTTDQNSQTTYCSVGEWDGNELSKVGEGLCNSALSKGMKITTAALAGPDDVYVAGSFTTQVWNGQAHQFVTIYNIAHYNAVTKIWAPLPIGQITCSWCQVTVLALAYDSKRRQLHVGGKFNAIDGHNIPSGLAIYDENSGHLVAHPGGGLTMFNATEDGVATALQLDEDAGVLYVMGSFERFGSGELCFGLGAFDLNNYKWTCLADSAHTVMPSGGSNMLLTPYGLMVAGRTGSSSTWPDVSKPYTIALLTATIQTDEDEDDDSKTKTTDGKTSKGDSSTNAPVHKFEWGWLPGFDGHDQPLHALANGFGDHEGTVFIAGDNFVAAWRYEERTETIKATSPSSFSSTVTKSVNVPVTINLSGNDVQGAVMAVAQLEMQIKEDDQGKLAVGYTIAIYLIAFGALLGMFLALMCNKPINQTLLNFLFEKDAHMNGISLDTLTYSAMKNTSVNDAYYRAMKTRCVSDPHLLQLIDPQEIILHRIIGEGTFGRVWSARLNSASVAVKEFVFAQAAVAGRSAQQNEIIEEIIGEAGMMAILRHPNVLQLFGCSLTAQAIWIVSELCSLGSLRHLLDDKERELPIDTRLKIALQVAEGMVYLHNQDPPIIHRDLKSHNILVHETFTEKSDGEWTIKASEVKQKVGSSGSSVKDKVTHRIEHSDRSQKMSSEATIIAKIGDWGSARATLSGTRTMTHGVGTACWLAPEVIKHARSSQHSDVYSYGIILWELATREEVYRDLEGTQIIARVANDGLRPPVPEESPFADLMVNCWCENPTDRLSFKEIVKELNKILSDLSDQKTLHKARKESSNQDASSHQEDHEGPSDDNE
mmetsp:Transcript_4248/g.8129  ORF Transcript_4248/g.8129 Transcript_4248/m.8129 type:complete len:1135 (+) Transcript_4248:233-3637(+)